MTFLEFWPNLSGASGLTLNRYQHSTRERIKDETVVASETFVEQCVGGFIVRIKRQGTEMTARVRCWAVKNDMQNLIGSSSWSKIMSETSLGYLLAKLGKHEKSWTPSFQKRVLRSDFHGPPVDHIFFVRQSLPDRSQRVFTYASQSPSVAR